MPRRAAERRGSGTRGKFIRSKGPVIANAAKQSRCHEDTDEEIATAPAAPRNDKSLIRSVERDTRQGGIMDQEIPGTTVFTGERSRQGYRLNRMAMSLSVPDNRERFCADETGYMAAMGLSEAEQEVVRRRDWSGM